MKQLNLSQMEELNGGTVGCAAAGVAGIGIIAVSGMTGGLGLFVAGLFFAGALNGLKDCVS